MKKFKTFLLVFIIMILVSGCDTKEEQKEEKLVKDPTIENALVNQVNTMNDLPKTIELYKKGNGSAKKYTKDDILLYGIKRRLKDQLIPNISNEELQQLNLRGIINVSSYIEIADVKGYAKENFDNLTLEYKTISGCPTYIYDENNKKYYIQDNCVEQSSSYVISYIDNITTIDNEYYVTLYAGLVENNIVYSDFDKKGQIADISISQSYEINDDNKGEFTKIVYTFRKNSANNYIFKNFNVK